VDRKKITAAFDGGRITLDAGVVFAWAGRARHGLADKLAAAIADPRNPLLITHPLGSILRTRILAVACGYEDGTISIICARTPPSGSLAALTRWGRTCARSPRCRAGRMR
jgi:hypothetical protein